MDAADKTIHRFVTVQYKHDSFGYDYLCDQEWAEVGVFVNVPVGAAMKLVTARITKVLLDRMYERWF